MSGRHSRTPSPSRDQHKRSSIDRHSNYDRHRTSDRRRYSPEKNYSRHHSSREYERSDRHRSNSRDRKRSGRYEPRELKSINNIPILPGESFTEYRMRVRNESTVTVWAPSPERPRSVSPEEKRRKNDSDSSDEERYRRKHKKHRRESKKKKRSNKKRRRYSDTEDDSSLESEKEETRVEKRTENPPVLAPSTTTIEELWVEKEVNLPEDLAPVGPVPLIETDTHNEREYGSALLPGEGSAMAAYVQQGKRIPRRGEIGLSGDQISDFEKAGFVMSGNRHQRMNAVRLRKENQVISAEEKRLVLQHAQEQKLRRENEIISGFREILSDKFKKEDD